MKKLYIFLFLMLLSCNASAFDLVGTWTLLSIDEQNPNGQVTKSCISPAGILIYTDAGYMSASINCMRARNTHLPSFQPKDMTFYSGRYLLKKNIIIHFVKNASDVTYYGKALEREIEILNNNKIILMAKRKNGNLIYLTWQRILN